MKTELKLLLDGMTERGINVVWSSAATTSLLLRENKNDDALVYLTLDAAGRICMFVRATYLARFNISNFRRIKDEMCKLLGRLDYPVHRWTITTYHMETLETGLE